ncbi:sigma-70 family RNA polymerase sigma factor [Limisphaera sp. VF-2]|uniref:sigma-70 family RNA polymerase sigma factor n=1 Tax=Limisphaera sp. VF-2 TaxID=3400418 RepID=UPI0017550445|nr:FliA/WhiG family RNA polymerase sigma factor [Limisphaera sp.]
MNRATCDPPAPSEPAPVPRPTPQELWKRYHRQADSQTENALVEQYLPLVMNVLGRLAMTLPEHVDLEDLKSAGLVGLLQALRHYNPACGTSFETYARTRIRGAMLDELRRMDWVPRTVHEKARRVQDAMARLEQELGGPPTEAQVARALGMTAEEYGRLLDEIRPAAFVCLDAAGGEDETGALYDVVADPNGEGPDEVAARRELKQIILQRLREMPEIQRKVLAMYYVEDLRLREIAEAFGLTESRICQIHAQAILSLRAYLQRYEAGLVQPFRGRSAA